MPQRFLLYLVVCCLIVISACADPALSKGHDVDADSDIIVGSEEARHELILYLSPGDIESLQLMLRRYRDIKKLYVDKKRLRVVIREVPQIVPVIAEQEGSQDRTERAQTDSTFLGVHLRCAHHFNGVDDYEETWLLVAQSVALAIALNRQTNWPYFSRPAMITVFDNMKRKKSITDEQLAECKQRSLDRQFTRRFDAHAEALADAMDTPLTPAAFLNGERVKTTAANQHNELMLALKENLDPEYALSRK